MNQEQFTLACPAPAGHRKSRKFRVCMRRLLALPVTDEKALAELAAVGIDENQANNYMLVALTVFRKAVGGDLKFIQELRQIVCDNETEIDRATGIAQLDKLRAQTEEIRRKCQGDDDDGGQAMSAFLDVLSRSAGSLADGNDVAECDDA